MKTNFSFRAFFLLLFCIFGVILLSLSAEAQQRKVSSFDADWRFLKSDAAKAEQTNFDDAAWRKLNVPHDWSIEGPFDENNPTGAGGGYLPSGVSWYRKHFTVSDKDKGKRFFVEFDGVMEKSDVWINGAHLGQRPNGYMSFEYELTDYLNFGKDNVIAVRADTSAQPASRWYTGAGIYRHVRLVAKNAINFPQYGVFVTTPKVDGNQAVVKVSGEVFNQSNAHKTVSMQIDLLDANGGKVGAGETKSISVAPKQTINLEQEIAIANPNRWHVDNPILYRASAKIRENGETIDDETVSFGIREFHFDPNTGFWLNGKNFKVKGVCLHQDGSAFGAAVPLAVWERRLNELKKLGANAIRTAHNPPAPEFLDLADKMVFL